jgi:hypothetical protein
MSDSVLAAIIAGSATLSASLLQLRSASIRNAGTRGAGAAGRRKSRLQQILLLGVIASAAVAGFGASQWLTEGERAAAANMQRELQARIAEVSRTAGELEQTRTEARAEIESDFRRRIGTEGIVVTATVAPCRPPSVGAADATPVSTGDGTAAAARPCTEAEASPVILCATIPANATVTDVALFSRPAEAETPWNASRFLPGQEADQARFSDKYSEGTPEADSRQVCQAFTHWSAGHARTVRVIFHYSLS